MPIPVGTSSGAAEIRRQPSETGPVRQSERSVAQAAPEATRPQRQGEQSAQPAPRTEVSAPEQRVSSALDVDAIRRGIEAVNGDPGVQERNLGFRVDDDTGKTLIKVIDLETEETVRQIPSEEFVELARRLQEFGERLDRAGKPASAVGSLIDLKA